MDDQAGPATRIVYREPMRLFLTRAALTFTVLPLLAGLAAPVAPSDTAPAGAVAWQPLYHGNFDDFRIYLRGRGYLTNATEQDVFVAEPDQIHVRKGTSGLLVTRRPYRHYHVRVQYRWGEPGGSLNAGLMTHVDLASTVVKDNRPRSVEINMRHDAPGSLWMAKGLGPFASTFVDPGTQTYLPESAGGTRVPVSPYGQRTVLARYLNGQLPTKPAGEWNTMEAIVRGAESVTILVNGQEVARLHDIRLADRDRQAPGDPVAEGGIGLQSEGQEIFYRAFELRRLEP
jgi:hypothetical protein